jgi:hypothetical protein
MDGEGAARMVLAPEEIASEPPRRQEQTVRRGAEAAEPPSVPMIHKGDTHISNETLLAAGGTIAGATLLGSALAGPIGAITAAIAGLGIAFYTAKHKRKEGTRRS